MTSEQVLYWGTSLGLLITVPLILLFGVWALAGLDIFFTFLAEGTGMFTMKGGKLVAKEGGHIVLEGGTYYRTVVAYDDYHLEYNRELSADEVVKGKEELGWSILDLIQRWFGIYWIGFYPFYNRHRYMFWWIEEVKKHKKVGEPEVRERNEATNYFVVAVVPYKIRIIGVEIDGNLLIDYEFTVFVQIILPEITIFRTWDWFQQLVDIIMEAATGYARDKAFATLNTKADKAAFAEYLKEVNPSLREEVGVKITRVTGVQVALTGGASDRINAAVTAQKVAEFEGDAAIMAAEKNAKVVRINAAAEIRRVRGVYRAITQHAGGLSIRRQEALERAGDKGNTIVFTGDGKPDAGDKTLVAIDRNNKHGGK